MTQAVKDLIMWVGAKPYPTWRVFADEARERGVCKRVKSVPNGITVGASKCYLIHGERTKLIVKCQAHHIDKHLAVPRCMICRSETADIGENDCQEHGHSHWQKPRADIYGYFVIEEIEKFTEDATIEVEDRLCGQLKPGGIYLTGPLVEFPEPRPWAGRTFVGYRYYQGSLPVS